jgi:O-succinylbenzoate synthase
MNLLNIEQHRYELRYKNSSKVRKGALLRFHFEPDIFGYSDCHVWEELGDLSLDQHLELLKDNILTEITSPALFFAKVDARARKEKIGLFSDINFPISHFVVAEPLNFTIKDFERVVEEGFSHIKIKIGRNLDLEVPQMKVLLENSRLLNVKLRIDCNESLHRTQFKKLLKEFSPWALHIDFWEDPYPFHPIEWAEDQKEYAIDLACDREFFYAIGNPDAAKVLVIKPAIQFDQKSLDNNKNQRLVITTYLGHPLGQAANACASLFLAHSHKVNIDVCGFLSHRVYERNEFSEQLPWEGPKWKSPPGTGFGFDQQLQSLKWDPL